MKLAYRALGARPVALLVFLWAQIKQKAKQRKTKTQNARSKNAKRKTQKRKTSDAKTQNVRRKNVFFCRTFLPGRQIKRNAKRKKKRARQNALARFFVKRYCKKSLNGTFCGFLRQSDQEQKRQHCHKKYKISFNKKRKKTIKRITQTPLIKNVRR